MHFSDQELKEIAIKASTLFEKLDGEIVVPKHGAKTVTNEKLLKTWCDVAVQGDWDKFEQRLSLDQYELKQVQSVLDTTEWTYMQDLPIWIQTFKKFITAIETTGLKFKKNKRDDQDTSHEGPPEAFEDILIPFLQVAIKKLRTKANKNCEILSKKAFTIIERDLLKKLSHLCARPLLLKFSVFRAIKKNKNIMSFSDFGNKPPTKLYFEFVGMMLKQGYKSFFKEYAVLAKLLAITVDRWVDFYTAFIFRLSKDKGDIEHIFNRDISIGNIVEIIPSLSDPHNGGQQTMIIIFDSGLKVVYKPKNVDLEVAYNSLLNYLNTFDLPLDFKTSKVISRSKYGWAEFIAHIHCKNREEVKNYYQRQGILLCLLYVLDATDCHFENIIAHGEYPILIDLETLMYPRVKIEAFTNQSTLEYTINELFRHSVQRVGLLPGWFSGPTGQIMNVGGAGHIKEQAAPFRNSVWKHLNSDWMNQEFIPASMTSPETNTPYLDGQALSPDDHQEDIIEGFESMYRFVVEYREDLLNAPNLRSVFLDLPVRFIVRDTMFYFSLLLKLLHPKYLQDGVSRSIQIDILSQHNLSPKLGKFWPLQKAEMEALELLDIPFFMANTNDDSFLFDTDKCIESFFERPSYESVLDKIKTLDEEDLKRQSLFVKSAFYVQVSNQLHVFDILSKNSSASLYSTVCGITREDLIQKATAIASELKQQAIYSVNGSVSWLTPIYDLELERYNMSPLRYDLYSGIGGIGVFLSALEKIINDSDLREFTMAVFQGLREVIHDPESHLVKLNHLNIGGASGLASIVYSLVKSSEFLNDNDLLKDAQKVANFINTDTILADEIFDVISGSAGAILGLLALYDRTKDAVILQRADLCGQHLLANRTATATGQRTWITITENALAGFSHGAAGIAYALLKLYNHTQKEEFRNAAQEALDFENSLFVSQEGNWIDNREKFEGGNQFMTSWCHGAPGIGLSRIGCKEILDTIQIKKDIDVAIKTTQEFDIHGIDHLCCGNMGLMDFLLEASQKLGKPELKEVVLKKVSWIVNRAKENGGFILDPRLPKEVYNPAFFVGTSGIGYELLRLAYPDRLPSVLLWE